MLNSQVFYTLVYRGYCSPEYALYGHVSTTLDVYSFGIFVLEIVSGRKNIDLQKPSEEIYLPNLVRSFDRYKYSIIDNMTSISLMVYNYCKIPCSLLLFRFELMCMNKLLSVSLVGY